MYTLGPGPRVWYAQWEQCNISTLGPGPRVWYAQWEQCNISTLGPGPRVWYVRREHCNSCHVCFVCGLVYMCGGILLGICAYGGIFYNIGGEINGFPL